MRFVPVKSVVQQAGIMILKTRDLLVRQRTRLINAMRGHAGEFGVIAAKGLASVEALLERAAGDETLPEPAREMVALLGDQIKDLDIRITALETRMKQTHKVNPVSQLLEGIPGVGHGGGDNRDERLEDDLPSYLMVSVAMGPNSFAATVQAHWPPWRCVHSHRKTAYVFLCLPRFRPIACARPPFPPATQLRPLRSCCRCLECPLWHRKPREF